MTYSNARIVRGNDFKLQITVEAPRDYISGETIWDDFDLTSCSEIHVALICEKDQIVIPLEYEIVKGTTNVLLCPVHGNYLHSGAAYGVEVKGVDGSGYAWRWKAKGKEMFSIVDNTSAQNLDDNLTPNNFDINARVGFEIHVDLSDYYTKEQVDASQAAQNEAIAALDDKVDVNEADIEAKLAAEIARARAAEQTNADAIDTLSGSTEGSFIQLTARIVAEENRAKAAEDDLETAIDNEEDRATAAEEALQASINAEAQAARQAEQANATAIANEATRAKAAEASLSTDISEEATRAKAAESTLQGNIDAEEARAKEAEQANTTAITNEVTRAQSAEATLQDNIDDEATRAQGVEATLQQSISTETTRAKAAEQANTTAITNEVTRAQLAEKDLQDKIDTLEAASGGDFSALTQRIAAEENRAKAAEQAIEADVDALEIAMPLKANSADLATVATSGSYNDLTDKPIIPTVPTNVSAFTNDSGYLIAADVAGKADKSDTYTKEEVDDKIDNIIGGEINLQNYYTKSEIDASQAAQDTAIAAKAPQATTYTKTEVNNLVSPKANSADLATVATSGSYNDLTDKPNIPAMQVQSDWNQTGTSEPDYIKNKPTIPTVPTDVSAFTNDAGYLINTDIEGKADKSDTYTKTEVDDIISQVQAGQGSSLKNYYTKTQIDSQQAVQDAAIALKANSADLATVATSGDYDDLSNKPTIPTVPTNVSAFTNDAGYLTKHQSLDNYYTKFETDNKIDDKIDAYVEENIYTVTETNAIFQQKIDAKHKLSSDLVDDTNNTNKFVTTEEKAAWNAKSDFSGSYNDLTNKPHIPNDQVQADWNQTGTSEVDYIKNKPTNVSAFNNDAGYLTQHQSLDNYYNKAQVDAFELEQNTAIAAKAPQATTYTKTEVDNLVSPKANLADLAKVATSGSYNDLLNKPHIPNDQVQADWNQKGVSKPDYIKNKPNLAKVATSGSYNDLTNKPHIPNDQVQADWGETGTGEPSYIKNKPNLATVATSGSYNDLSNKPTNVSDFTNDSGYLNYTGAAQLFYDKTAADQLLALKANSADLAKVATSGSYNDLLNKPTIPNGMTFAVLPKKYSDGKISFDIAQLNDGKLGQDYGLEISKCADTEEAEQWWEDNGLAELHYSTDNGANWTKYNMTSYADAQNGPVKITLGTSGIYWKLYWWDELTNEIQSGVITGDTDISGKADISEVYTKSESDGKFLARYRKIQLSSESLGEGDDVETWHGVGKFWNSVAIYWGSGADDKWDMTGYEFPAAYDSASDNYYVKINNVHTGDEIAFLNMLLKETPSATPHILIINNSGTTVWSEEIPVNSQTNTTTLYTSYTFEADYDYIIIGTDCDKPAYVQKIEYYVPLADNSDLGYVIPTISQVEGELGNKVNYWDIVQSDWAQSDTGAKDYIKNKPNLATVATSGSYNDLLNKPTKVSEFINDAGYLTKHQSLANCVQSTTANLKIEVVSKMPASPQNNTLYIVQ